MVAMKAMKAGARAMTGGVLTKQIAESKQLKTKPGNAASEASSLGSTPQDDARFHLGCHYRGGSGLEVYGGTGRRAPSN